MAGSSLALLLLVPAAGVFVYAGWKEYRRYRADGPSSYGLTYDPETNTTHVGPLADGDDGYDPETFEPLNEDTQADAMTDAQDRADTDPDDDTGQDKPT